MVPVCKWRVSPDSMSHLSHVVVSSILVCAPRSPEWWSPIFTPKFPRHFLDIVGTVYHLVIYMQSNKIHSVVLMSKFYSALFVSSTCFGPHLSIIRSVLYKLYLQTLVCGTIVRTTTYQSLRIHLVQNAPDDGQMRSETCRANLSAE